MDVSRKMFRTLITVLIALAVNVILDGAFDLPMLVRWALTVGALLAVVAAIELIQRRTAVASATVSVET